MLNYYGEYEVSCLLRRMFLADEKVKENIKNYIIEAEYEIDEENFLSLLEMKDFNEVMVFYEDMDTAARETFVCILMNFYKELMVTALLGILLPEEMDIIVKSIHMENKRLDNLIEENKSVYPREVEIFEKKKKDRDMLFDGLYEAYKRIKEE